MQTLGEIMTTDLHTLEPEMTLREAIEELANARVSGAPVVTGGRLVGVVSTSDILEHESTNPGVPTERTRPNWDEGEPPDPLDEEASGPTASYFRGLWSDSGADVAEQIAESEGPEWDFLTEHVVAEVMTHQVLALPPDAEIPAAAHLMVERDVHRLLVMEGDELRGIVTAMDFVRAVAEGRLRPSS